ncbi:hypothetical protein [Kordiimonas sp.]|uniref:hypothetical protein n=1 Tax=Kordiimonas sp. TaxID=1970157 RepID=UPI003A9416FC
MWFIWVLGISTALPYDHAMFWKRIKTEEVMGRRIAPPRITFGAATTVLIYILLPVFGFLALLDIALYFYFQHVLERCYGILCYFS